jgi:hypothetical protein
MIRRRRLPYRSAEIITDAGKKRSMLVHLDGTRTGPATSSDLIRLAVAYNDALDRRTQTGGANIDEVMDLLAEDATWTLVGGESLVGKAAIRASYLRRTSVADSSSHLRRGARMAALLSGISKWANSKGSTCGVIWWSAEGSGAPRPSCRLGANRSCGSCW